MAENTSIICQRFSQNAWKKDLCSNCFKSKEDHDLHVHVPRPTSYRYQPILNFPHQGILKESNNGKRTGSQTESKDKLRTRVVSFRTTETEIIGFGGGDDDDQYSSSDDDQYCSIISDNGATNSTNSGSSTGTGTDNEDELEFRKLTRSNTDFNSIAANLNATNDEQISSSTTTTTAVVRKSYVDLKLGKPLVDGKGCRRTLHVAVEPLKNCARFATPPKAIVAKTALDTSETDAAARKRTNNADADIDASTKPAKPQTDDSNSISSATKSSDKDAIIVAAVNDECVNSTSSLPSSITDDDPSESIDSRKSLNTDDVEGHRQACEARIDTLLRPIGSAGKDSNPICLPLIACKSLEIEFDQPGSRELVGEPDGKADSDDSFELLHSSFPPLEDRTNTIDKGSVEMTQAAGQNATIIATVTADDTTTTITTTETGNKISPQRSFLHNFDNANKDDVEDASTSPLLADSSPPTRPLPSNSSITLPTAPSTPKLTVHCAAVSGGGPGNSSTKRPAPKPPSPKTSTPSTATFALAQNRRHNRSRIAAETDYCESPLMSGTRDAISFLTGTGRTTEAKRRTSLYDYFDNSPINRPSSSRNSLNFCLSPSEQPTSRVCSLRRYSTAFNDSCSLSGVDVEQRWPSYSADTASVCSSGTVRLRKYDSPVAKKCARSLSYDSIPTPPAVFALSQKTAAAANKYSVATIKVKSTLRRFLRFSINNTGSTRITNNKDEPRRSSRSDTTAVAASSSSSSVPRKRPVIIHPLDLNKSSVQIVTMGAVNEYRSSSEKTEHKTVNKTKHSSAVLSNNSIGSIYATPIGRPTKPPPPPRTQSLDQCKYSSYMDDVPAGTNTDTATTGTSKPIRPPPPKTTSSPCENISNGESRQGVAPTKPQRASSMRDRTRQPSAPSVSKKDEYFNSAVTLPESECDQNTALRKRPDCGLNEIESDLCFSSTASSEDYAAAILKSNDSNCEQNVTHTSLEDNYGAVVIANHEALSQLLERINGVITVPDSLKVLQHSSTNIRFDDLTACKTDKITVADWTFFNALWNSHNVVISVSQKHSAPMRSLPADITLCPLVKFTDSVPYTLLDDAGENADQQTINAHIIVWNEERIDSITRYCSSRKNTDAIDSNSVPSNVNSEYGLVLTQLTNALKYLQACGIEDVSLDEIFVCKRNSNEPKLLLLPFNVDYISSRQNIETGMSLCECISTVVDALLPELKISQVIKRILRDERASSLTRTKSVVEYWLWGPPLSSNVSRVGDRQMYFQRWLDLERATYLHKMVCKQSHELTLVEKCRLTFLVRTNAKIMSEASYLLDDATICK